jgi:NADH-quinone oxidoreductase subunit E
VVSQELRTKLQHRIEKTDQPREAAVDVIYALQRHYGYMSDEAVYEAADILGMTPLEIEELATFYDFIYREPVGRYVIHVCDSTVCWMHGHQSIVDYLCERLDIDLGGTTRDGLFTLLPICCVGYCDHAPVMLINGKPFGRLTPESIDMILLNLREQKPPQVEGR